MTEPRTTIDSALEAWESYSTTPSALEVHLMADALYGAREAEARVRSLVDDWESQAGEGTEAWQVFGPQVLSVPFAVREVRAALDGTK